MDYLCFFVSCVSHLLLRLFIAALWLPAGEGLSGFSLQKNFQGSL